MYRRIIKSTNRAYWSSIPFPENKLLIFRNIYNIITDFSEFFPNGTQGVSYLPPAFMRVIRNRYYSDKFVEGVNTELAIPYQIKRPNICNFSLFYESGSEINTMYYSSMTKTPGIIRAKNPSLIAIAGERKHIPTALITDSLEGYFKLSNWFLNDLKIVDNKRPTVVIYAKNNLESFTETLRAIFHRWGTVVSFGDLKVAKCERYISLPQYWLIGCKKRLDLFRAIKTYLKD